MMIDWNEFTFKDKYTKQEGPVILTGLQALVRLPLDQHLADKRARLNTATLISGYRGSPIAGLDMLFEREKKLLDAHNVTFMPGVNEDLGATAVFGSQIANTLPDPKYDGVLGMWYGKAPGVDRSGDVFKHGNFTGVGRYGGVLAIAGDDPIAKSSTLPSASEVAFYDAQMPVLYPGDIQEVIEFGRYGFELSRYSGLWVGFKIVTDIADGFGTACVREITDIVRPEFEFNGRPWQANQDTRLVAPFSLQLERELNEGRLEAAKRFAAANNLNQITVSGTEDRLGIVAAGKTYYDLREALDLLSLDEAELNRYGIRLLKIGMLYPAEPEIIKRFASGLREILVIEEKRAFVEVFIRDVLYNHSERPLVFGKRDEAGQPLVRSDSELDVDQVTRILGQRLTDYVPSEVLKPHLTTLRAASISLEVPMANDAQSANRSPYFCSGCPHNRSTVVPEGSIAGGGIGCHGMVLNMDRNTEGITHMGGEGVQWVGAAPFSNTTHMFQNIGDGTLAHSGYLAIRQAIAAGTNITYKILYNEAVAMTGAQPADGGMAVPELTRALHAEGVNKIIVCADEPEKYPTNTQWAPGTTVWHRDRLDDAQHALRDEPGVTILIYDQPCAADLRRQRKRGQAVDPPTRIFINEAVCEGCGDCGVKSNCLSVVPVDTEFGRKTQIHQASCNKDYTCLEGDCPSFVTVIPDENMPKKRGRLDIQIDLDELPKPERMVGDEANIYMVGIGGTGVVTINQILGTAAFLEGKVVRNLDQTGLSQKGGPVLSHVKIARNDRPISNKVGNAAADAYLVFDPLEAAKDKNLQHATPKRTVAVVSMSEFATGEMIRSTELSFPQMQFLKRSIDNRTQPERNIYLDAKALSENVFGTHMQANMICIGAAYQAGVLPLDAETLEHTITINGVAVKSNMLAFRIGRKLVADPDWHPLKELKRDGDLAIQPEVSSTARALIDTVQAEGELLRLLEIRVPELIDYQNVKYARSYVAFVKRVREAEARVTKRTELSEAVAHYLFKLMAYKDEYEVGRLHLKSEFQQQLIEQFGPNAKITYKLHPPFLRALGIERKIGLGKWFDVGYKLLYRLRFLRGTPFDVFGYAHVRKVERELIDQYRAMIEEELATLSTNTYERSVELAKLPDLIRGYEDIKIANVEKYYNEIDRIKSARVMSEAAD